MIMTLFIQSVVSFSFFYENILRQIWINFFLFIIFFIKLIIVILIQNCCENLCNYNKLLMSNQGISFFIFIFTLTFYRSMTLVINMILPDNTTLIEIYSNGSQNNLFLQQQNVFDCSLPNFYSYLQTPQQYQNNTTYQLQFIGVGTNFNLSMNTKYGIITPGLSSNNCIQNCNISIRNNCPLDLTQFKYFDIIKFQVNGLPNTFSYNVLCNTDFYTNTFEWGLVIMILACTVLLVVVTIYSMAWSIGGAGIKMNYWIVLAFWILAAIVGVIGYFTTNAVFPILEVITLIMGVFGIWVCTNQCLFLLKIKILSKGITIKEPFKIRIMDIISLLIAAGLVVGYAFSSKNWILNDILCVCTIIASIKIFKFTNLKIAIFAMCIGLAVEITFVELIHFQIGTSYNNFILNDYNYPFQLQLPTVNPVFNQKCAWFAFTSIIFPGIFMSYLRRFDLSRNTNIYLITAVCVFILGSALWMVISITSDHSWPFEIVTSPTMIALVSIFAYQRKQIRTLWEGSFYDEDFANRDGLKQINDTIKNQQNQDVQLIRNSMINGLKITGRTDSDLSTVRGMSKIQSQSYF